jgi:hypothetical protein
MSKSKHTRGPFRSEGHYSDLSGAPSTIRILAPKKENGWATVIAQITVRNTTVEEAFANGHLFSAAPEMLEVLRLVSGAIPPECSITLDRVRAVIAKAEGGES